jgi:tetratricopeptide (TPR) repeat protein
MPLLLLALAVLLATPVAAMETVEEFDVRIAGELAAQSPEAAQAWKDANAARAVNARERAAELYAQVERLAPASSHAFRRHCALENAMDHRADALLLCRKALALERSAQNCSVLADVLASSHTGSVTPEDLAEASKLAEEAVKLDPGFYEARVTAAHVALQRQDLPALRGHAAKVMELAPDQVGGWYLGAIAALLSRDFPEAQRRLDRAKELGLAPDAAAGLQQGIDEHRPWHQSAALRSFAPVLLLLVALGAVWLWQRRRDRAAAPPPAPPADGQAG